MKALALLLLLTGCPPQPAPSPRRPPPACTVVPALVADTFCEGYYAGSSPCVPCFATVGIVPSSPIFGCLLPNNQYCVDASGCDDTRCAAAPRLRARPNDGGVK